MSPFERLRGAHLTSHPVIEDLVFTLLSLLVATVAISVLIAPSKPSLALAIQPDKAMNEKQIEVYGSLLDENGVALKNALIEITTDSGVRVAFARTKIDGTFSTKFTGVPGEYTITVTTTVDGNPVTASTSLAMSPGMQWGLQMTLSQGSTWVFVPLPGY